MKADADELWHAFCQRDFKGRDKSEANCKYWYQFYDYLVEERENKLKAITAGISSKARKAVPGKNIANSRLLNDFLILINVTILERTVQQIALKTPREIRRRQERSANPFFSSGGGGNSSRGGSRLITNGGGSVSTLTALGNQVTIAKRK